MSPETIAVIVGLALWAALVTAALVAFARALHSRARRREQYREAVAEAMSATLAAPTRIPRGLSKIEVETCAPASTITPLSPKHDAELAYPDSFHTADGSFSDVERRRPEGCALKGPRKEVDDASQARAEEGDTISASEKVGEGEVTGTCPVCLDDLRVGQRRRTIKACGHTFHSRCLRVWLRRDDTCPCCRTRLGAAPAAMDGIEVIQRAQLALLNRRANGNATSQSGVARRGSGSSDRSPGRVRLSNSGTGDMPRSGPSVIVTISPGGGGVTTLEDGVNTARDEASGGTQQAGAGDVNTFSQFTQAQRAGRASVEGLAVLDMSTTSPVSSAASDHRPSSGQRHGLGRGPSLRGLRRKRHPEPEVTSSSELGETEPLRTIIVRSDWSAHRRRTMDSIDSDVFSNSESDTESSAL